jgi:hypothetical protein
MKRALKYVEQFDYLSQAHGARPICQLDTPAGIVRRRQARAADGEVEYPNTQIFMLAHSGIKPDGMEILPEGISNADFRENPVVMLNHSMWSIPEIVPPGRSLREWLEKPMGKMKAHYRAEAEFASTASGKELRAAYGSKFMNAVSIRWDALDGDSIEEIPESELRKAGVEEWIIQVWGGIRYRTSRLLEYSFVHLPMDPGAVAVRNQDMSFPEQYPTLAAAYRQMTKPAMPNGRGLMRFGWGATPFEVDIPSYLDVGAAVHARAALIIDDEAKTLEWETEARAEDEPEEVGVDVAAELLVEPGLDEREVDDEDDPTETGGGALGAPVVPEVVVQVVPEVVVQAEGADARGVISFADAHPSGCRRHTGAWNSAAAVRRMRKWASSDGTGDRATIRSDRYRTGFCRYDEGSPTDLSSYQFPHHDVVNGALVSVRDGVLAACQSVMRAGGCSAVREHLAQECALHDLKAPWETSSGRLYEQACREYAQAKPGSGEATELQATIVQFATRARATSRRGSMFARSPSRRLPRRASTTTKFAS